MPDQDRSGTERLFVTKAIEDHEGTAVERALAHDQLSQQARGEAKPKDADEKTAMKARAATSHQVGADRLQIEIGGARRRSSWYQVLGAETDGTLYQDKPRDYRASALPVVRDTARDGSADDAGDKILLTLYETAVGGWRVLTDVRFKLLGLLPAVSVIVWAQLLSEEPLRFGSGRPVGLAIGIAGLMVSLGIWAYDQRNNELYNELISRARRIETELGVDTGVFRGRPAPNRKLISHGPATTLVYATVLIGWLAVIAWFLALTAGLIDPGSLMSSSAPPATTVVTSA